MKRGIIFFSLLLLSLSFAQAQLGGFGKLKKALDKAKKFSDLEITEEDEIALGEAVSEKIRSLYGVQQDQDPHRYLALVGLLVAEKSTRPGLPYHFIILDSNAINAFAAPGGYVHITRGALAAVRHESELAGVLGHEIAHVTEKHTLKGLQKMKGLELAEGETSLRSNSVFFQKVVAKATEAVLQGFGRAEELEADQAGIRLAAKCGYDPSGLSSFLETLKAQNEGASSRAGLFASHPETDERIQKLKAQVEKEKLLDVADVSLTERFDQFIQYELQVPEEGELAVEGSKGVAGQEKKSEEKGEKKKSRFSLASLKNPTGSGEKKQTAEVTGAGAGRAVGKEEAEQSQKPKNPQPIKVEVSKDEVKKFKEEGKLQ